MGRRGKGSGCYFFLVSHCQRPLLLYLKIPLVCDMSESCVPVYPIRVVEDSTSTPRGLLLLSKKAHSSTGGWPVMSYASNSIDLLIQSAL